MTSVAFSPDGKLLATAYQRGPSYEWNLAVRLPVTIPISTGIGGADAVTYSPDGRLLATVGSNGTVRLWNPATGQPAGSPLPADTGGSVNAVAFSPNGKILATADTNGTVQLWQVALFANPYETLCTDAGPPSQQEWDTYAPDEPFPKTCALTRGTQLLVIQ